MNTFIETRFLIFFLHFTENRMKLSQYSFSTVALGRESKCFPYWTRNKKRILWLLYPSFILMVAFCSVSDMSSCEWLGFTQKFLKTNLKNTDFLLRSASRSLLKCHVVLSYFAAYFWLVALLTGSNYTFLLAANLCFSVATFLV